MSNKSIDKMAAQFTSLEELQAYCDSQYKTIITLNQRIHSSEKELENLREENTKLRQEQVVAQAQNSLAGDSKFSVTDEESICVIQIAMLKASALSRELSMDECKKLDTFVRVLLAIRGKEAPKKGKDAADLNTDELLKMMDEASKSEPQ